MKSLFSDLTKETINIVFRECEREKNKHKIENFINKITKIAFTNIQPYLYTIMAILVLMFTMNCFQFYYYIKLFILNNKISNLDDIITRN
jgi:cell division protein FtsL